MQPGKTAEDTWQQKQDLLTETSSAMKTEDPETTASAMGPIQILV